MACGCTGPALASVPPPHPPVCGAPLLSLGLPQVDPADDDFSADAWNWGWWRQWSPIFAVNRQRRRGWQARRTVKSPRRMSPTPLQLSSGTPPPWSSLSP
jgi:hypothetical protein